MERFEYADNIIGDREIMIAVPSIVIGVGVLSMPRYIANPTIAVDGLMTIIAGGVLVLLLTWLVAKLASQFPRQNFIDYATLITSRPLGIMFTFLLAVQGLMLAAYETRVIADVATQYLFDQTPYGVVGLSFLLVVVYAVSGTRAGLFRLNMMFFPIILVISILVMLLTTGLFEAGNLLPVFKTDVSGHWEALKQSIFSFLGIGILLFYTALVRKPENVPRKACIGMSIAVFLYCLIYITCIAVFGNLVAGNLMYPTVELAKDVQIPGGFFERFESLFFVIWIMAIFNTTAMAFDVTVFALNSIFRKNRKMQLIFLLAPIIYVIGMTPKDTPGVTAFGTFVSYYGMAVTTVITVLLFIVARLRGVKSQ
ncbi:endospore germination permease [Lentibacillus sp. CBA3610]|uniref:GerAB/ArcD/ProY family transporter n=1 Tax=Lentibacillus sp. CBA3610 TaxID=2518176 RepID=UPI0015952B6B|nr:endospore germination permease [Lentibacillus sp. CBA3610]QKY71445.1 spore gernimation protein [Lentibacillus sp. CBA3610]